MVIILIHITASEKIETNMKKLNILDCSSGNGRYYNNWKFYIKEIKSISTAFIDSYKYNNLKINCFKK